ncbi:hypothetical protein BDZ45DRAFT_182284 [Acephala macrosclerotiorum]|nr:hypothetical protein BDZ45DRAFT_182284 [Acephala macrosclerotiorum]
MRIARCDIGAMTIPWPQVAAWPNDIHEHATYLSDYLRKALACIDSAEDQQVPKSLVRSGDGTRVSKYTCPNREH